MVQFALYEQNNNDDFHYVGSVNSQKNLQKVYSIHKTKTDGKLRFVPLSDSEYIPYNFSTEKELNDKCFENKDLID